MKKSLLIASLLCFSMLSYSQVVLSEDEDEEFEEELVEVKKEKPAKTKSVKVKPAKKAKAGKAAKAAKAPVVEEDFDEVDEVEDLTAETVAPVEEPAYAVTETEDAVDETTDAVEETTETVEETTETVSETPETVETTTTAGGAKPVKGAHPYKLEENENVAQEYAHWSLIPRAGFNSFDGDFSNEKAHAFAVPTAGLALEYNFTPVWSFGIEYMYDMYTVVGKQGVDVNGDPLQNADTLLNGHLHRAGAYIAMDLLNLLFPKAQKKVFSFIPYIGAGGVWYKRTAYFKDDKYWGFDGNGKITSYNPTHGRGQTTGYINADGEIGKGDYDTDYNMEGYIQAGIELECNLNRTIALGLRANYTYFTRDYFDGRGYYPGNASYASKNNDGIFEVTANLRFKLEAVSKTHVRNISTFDTWKKEEKKESQNCHDTIIIKHDSIIIRETYKQQVQKEQNRIYYVYFENNKSNLDDKALITIQQVADILAEDTTLYAVVTGYCDNTGSASLNYALGDKRATNVMDELTAEHLIAPERLYAMGMGKVIGHRSLAAYGPNRRAAIRLVDKATFLRMQQDLDGKRAERIVEEDSKKAAPAAPATPAVKTVPLKESAKPAPKPNEYKSRAHEEVTVETSTTLSKLARKYYNNTYCWVYIYMANSDKISNPNTLTPGIKLTIPELTKEEMQITKDESLVVYTRARQHK